MSGHWIFPVVAFAMLNGFVYVFLGQAYTAWSIRLRNEAYYFLFRRPVNRERADKADEIAEGVVRWLRPVGFLIANAFWAYLVWTSKSPL
jgi:hypothetical protein